MKFENLDLLPAALVHAILNDDYDAGALTDVSVTKLIDAPQILRLQRKHDHEMVKDARREVASFIGKAVH